ncbi:MAG: 50S ribosomal protein L3 [Cystobacterineae bacterium]|nr:50S ribosomal protein L3 [Cystobacterineae bacterium]
MKGLVAKKVGMTQVFDANGMRIPVTVLDASTCMVVGKRSLEKDGYSAVILGFGEIREKLLNAARKGVFKKAEVAPRRTLREFRVTPEEAAGMEIGKPVSVEMFAASDWVDVSGISKGRGMQGVMRRWNFSGFFQTHGTHEYRRHPGSIGQRKTPGRVHPNKKQPGHMGSENVTTQNLKVVEVIPERNLILLKGAVPGHNNSLICLRPSIKLAQKQARASKSSK